MYCIEVSKEVGLYWLLVPVSPVGRLVRSRYSSLPQSAGFQAKLEGIHAISRPMFANSHKISGGGGGPSLKLS